MRRDSDRLHITVQPPDRSHEPVDFGAPFEPPAGRVLHCWGQLGVEDRPHLVEDAELSEYEATIEPKPGLVSTYAHVHDTSDGILDAFCQGIGNLLAKRPQTPLIVGLHVRPVEKVVASGACDESLRRMARRLRELDIPVWLRIGYEFNLSFDPHDAEAYKDLFPHIVDLFRREEAHNVASTWCSAAGSFQFRDPFDWWPGNEYVDWAAMDVFAPIGFERPETTAYLDRCRDEQKPVMIPESCPFFFDWNLVDPNRPESFSDGLLEIGDIDDQWAWYEAMFELVRRRPEIKALTVIATDWRDGMFPFYGDTRIGSWNGLPERYGGALSHPRFMHRQESLDLFQHR